MGTLLIFKFKSLKRTQRVQINDSKSTENMNSLRVGARSRGVYKGDRRKIK